MQETAQKNAKNPTHKKALIASTFGTSLENYDFYLYGTAAALYFNKIFFSETNATVATLSSFLIFAMAFLTRPLGAMLFGYIGDTKGRAVTTRYTLTLMGLSTAAIGLLPGYSQVGILAPILLVLLRCIQGISMGGEWGGSILLSTEYSSSKKKDFHASIPQLGSPIGVLASTFIFMIMEIFLNDQQMLAWGWRIPFLLALPFTLVSVYIRTQLHETNEFMEAQKELGNSKIKVSELFKNHTIPFIQAILIGILPIGSYFLISTYTMNYGTTTLGLPEQSLLVAGFIGSLLQLITIPTFGYYSSKYSSKAVMIAGAVSTAIVAIPMYLLMREATLSTMIACMLIGGIFPTLCWATLGGMLYNKFDVKIRFTAINVAYSIAAIISGFIPAITTMVGSATHQAWWHPAIVLILISLMTLAGSLDWKKKEAKTT
ncbi:MAG: MFS transporter [Micrococcaceae bacterium]